MEKNKKGIGPQLSESLNMIQQNSTNSQFKKFLTLLRKITSNIQNNPSRDRFRTLKRDNPALKSKFFIHPEVDRLLSLLDFTSTEELAINLTEDFAKFEILRQLIEGFLLQIEIKQNNANLSEKGKQAQQREKTMLKQKQQEMQKQKKLKEEERDELRQEMKDRPVGDSRAVEREFGA